MDPGAAGDREAARDTRAANAPPEAHGGASTVIGVGGSAGAIRTLLEIAAGLPEDLAAAVLVVIHRPAHSRSALPGLLAKASGRPCSLARTGDPLRHGTIYVAPPDFHMRVWDGTVTIDQGPRENRNRPAIDPLFRSLAATFGPSAVGVLLSGILDDGTAGLSEIKQAGGIVVIQDPADAVYPNMPEAAAREVDVDHSVAGREIGPLLGRIATQLAGARRVQGGATALTEVVDEHTDLSCPDCGGVLRISSHARVPRFVCRVGHAFSAETLGAAQNEQVEQALWFALRALRERVAGAERLSQRFANLGDAPLAERYRRRAEEADSQSLLIRSVLEDRAEHDAALELGPDAPGTVGAE